MMLIKVLTVVVLAMGYLELIGQGDIVYLDSIETGSHSVRTDRSGKFYSKLPKELGCKGINGKIVAVVWLNNKGEVIRLAAVVLILRKANGHCFIDYRGGAGDEEISSTDDYPLPIKPYVEFIRTELSKLSFIGLDVDKIEDNSYGTLDVLFNVY